MPSTGERHAVAVAVRREDGLLLAVRRPDEPGEELPGVWGLPATTLHEGESPEDGVRRIGREKLGVELTPVRAIGEGEQARPSGEGRKDYTLRMTLYEASLAGEPSASGGPARAARAGVTLYDAVDWLADASFRAAADQGSLCCELLLAAEPK